VREIRHVTPQVVVLGFALVFVIAAALDTKAWLSRDRSFRVLSAVHMFGESGPLIAHVREALRLARERSTDEITPKEIDEVKAYAIEKRRALTTTSDLFGAFVGKSVLYVQLEGMQQYVTDLKYRGEQVMPFWQELRARSLEFDNVYDLTGMSNTSDCEYMVNNGLHPLSMGSVAFRRPENDFITIANTLRVRGYSTFSGHAYRQAMWNRAVLHPRYGYERSMFEEDLPREPRIGWGLSDKAFFAEIAPELRALKRPFFSLLITLTSHHPYRYIPSDERTLALANRSAFAGYLHSMRYVDEALAELFATLEKDGVLDDTVVVLFGDHDSRFSLDDDEVHMAALMTDIDAAVLESVAVRGFATDKVPFLVVPPRGSSVAPRRVATVGGQLDIPPTVLHLLGVETPPAFIGASLVPERPGLAAHVDGQATDGVHVMTGRAENARCMMFPLGPRVDNAECADLRKRADRESRLSERATLYDLASVLAQSTERTAHGSTTETVPKATGM
jgi:phosphoglycerol transferase MdoB-like AlkP superfamily enzyme